MSGLVACVLRRLAIAVLALSGCASPGNSVEGTFGGAMLRPVTVVSFQLALPGSFGGVGASTPFTDLIVAVFDVGGGCELLDSARPDSKPMALWVDFSSPTGPAPGRFAFGDSSRSLSADVWPRTAALCDFQTASSGSATLDSAHGDVSGSFDLGFRNGDSLQGTFDATPCGAPPPPESQGLPGCL